MSRHKLNRNDFRLGNGAVVNIEYWTAPTSVHVAAYDADGHQISRATYQASVDKSEELDPALLDSLLNSLANALEYELTNSPDIHLRQR